MGPALLNVPSTPGASLGLNKPSGVIWPVWSTQLFHQSHQKRNPAAVHLPPPWLPDGERVQGRRTGRFSRGDRQTGLIPGPHGRDNSRVMPLTTGSRQGKESLHGVMPLPTSPSGPALAKICSKPRREPASLQRYHLSDIVRRPLRTQTGDESKPPPQSLCAEVPTLAAFYYPLSPLPPKFPSLTRDSISSCALFGSFHTFLLAGDNISRERQTKAVGAMRCHSADAFRYPARSTPALTWD